MSILDLELSLRSSLLLTYDLVHKLGMSETNMASRDDEMLLRLYIPIAKLYTAKLVRHNMHMCWGGMCWTSLDMEYVHVPSNAWHCIMHVLDMMSHHTLSHRTLCHITSHAVHGWNIMWHVAASRLYMLPYVSITSCFIACFSQAVATASEGLECFGGAVSVACCSCRCDTCGVHVVWWDEMRM